MIFYVFLYLFHSSNTHDFSYIHSFNNNDVYLHQTIIHSFTVLLLNKITVLVPFLDYDEHLHLHQIYDFF